MERNFVSSITYSEEYEKEKINKIIRERKYFPYCDNLNGYIWISIIILLPIILVYLHINIRFALIFSTIVALLVYMKLPIRGDLEYRGSIESSLIFANLIFIFSIIFIILILCVKE